MNSPTADHQRGCLQQFDVLVLGSGISGLLFVLELVAENPQLRVALVCKQQLGEGNSRYAQGGIAAVSSDLDSIENHIRDTLAAGDGLCNEKAVREILDLAPSCMQKLMEHGVPFDRADSGDYDLTLEGGHSYRRIYHCGDRTGAVIVDTLVKRLRELENVCVFEFHTAVNLITQVENHAPGHSGEVLGAYVLEGESGGIHRFMASCTVLATGGAGKIFRYTSNPESATGDGVAMAYRAGARVGNMEFYQFHPTLLYHPKVNNFLITEALRGEGAVLTRLGSKERFMSQHCPEKMELDTRDKVARAIFTEMEQSSDSHVLLDISERDSVFVRSHFPMIYQTLQKLGLDITQEPIPVVPAAHYLCGGVLTDFRGACDLNRLLVIGESAFTGLHGANRLASNSLIEGVVMGVSAAPLAAELAQNSPILQRQPLDWDSASVRNSRRASQVNAHWRGLRNEMTSYAGMVRTEQGLLDLLNIISVRREMIEGYYWRHRISRDLLELRNIALLSELIAKSALHRRESRGGHFREDHPQQVPHTRDTVLTYHEQFPTDSSHFERPQA